MATGSRPCGKRYAQGASVFFGWAVGPVGGDGVVPDFLAIRAFGSGGELQQEVVLAGMIGAAEAGFDDVAEF